MDFLDSDTEGWFHLIIVLFIFMTDSLVHPNCVNLFLSLLLVVKNDVLVYS